MTITREQFDDHLLHLYSKGVLDHLGLAGWEEDVIFSAMEGMEPHMIPFESPSYTHLNSIARECLSEVWKHFMDRNAVAAREDNALNTEGVKRVLAQMLIDNGLPEELTPSYYGWRDYEFAGETHGDVIAVLDVKEDYWEEFGGTDCDGTHHHGLIGVLVFSDGSVRTHRMEMEVGEMISAMMKADAKVRSRS